MNIPRVLAIYVELLREAVLLVRIMRLTVGRARITTQLHELLSLVEPAAEVAGAAENVQTACVRLFEVLKANDLPGLTDIDAIRIARRDVLRAVDALEQALQFAAPSDEARALGLDWCAGKPVGSLAQR